MGSIQKEEIRDGGEEKLKLGVGGDGQNKDGYELMDMWSFEEIVKNQIWVCMLGSSQLRTKLGSEIQMLMVVMLCWFKKCQMYVQDCWVAYEFEIAGWWWLRRCCQGDRIQRGRGSGLNCFELSFK